MHLFLRKKTIVTFSASALFSLIMFAANAKDGKIFPIKGFKEGKAGFPAGWHHQYNKLATYRLIKDPTFKINTPVMKIENPEASLKPVSIRTINFTLPEKGKIEASVWAKGTGKITIFLIQSDWKGPTFKKIFQITPTWKKYTFIFDFPADASGKEFHYRIDCDGKGQLFLADPSLLPKS